MLFSWKVSAWLGWRTGAFLACGVCGSRCSGSALCVAVPGEFKHSPCVRPCLCCAFLPLRDVTGSFLRRSLYPVEAERSTALTPEHAGIPSSGSAFSVLWLVPPAEWECCILSVFFCPGACVAPMTTKSVAEKNDCLSEALGLALCSPCPLSLFQPVRASLSPVGAHCP